MKYENWMLGKVGSERIRFLSQHLFEKIRNKEARRTSKSVEKYLPWFSCESIASGLESFRNFPMFDGEVLKDEALLKHLRKTVWTDRSKPLGSLSIYTNSIALNVRPTQKDLVTYLRAIELVKNTNSYWSMLFDSLAKTLIPLKAIGSNARVGGVGFSSEFVKGAIFLSIPSLEKYSDLELSINLAHELGHQALMIYQAADRIIEGPLDQPIFSAVRKTDRPAIHSFHAMTALVFMCDYLNCKLQSPFDLRSDEIAYLKKRYDNLFEDFGISITAFKEIALTEIGQRIYSEYVLLCNNLKDKTETSWKPAASL